MGTTWEPPYPYIPIVDRPPVAWPGGARVAVWVIPNIEHYHLDRFVPGHPDVRNFSRRDYGNRVGIWRLMDVMDRHGVRGTVALNADVCDRYPPIVEACLARGWELMGHGLTNSVPLHALGPDEEARVIRDCCARIRACGTAVHGWLGPGLGESWRTLDLLRAEGVEYVCDWVNDDLPYRMDNGLYAIPYSIELNDMPLFNNPSISVADFERRIRDTFDVLYAEGRRGGRVMAIALHPFLIGVPHRIASLQRALTYIGSHRHVWFATGHEIIDSYRRQTG